MYLGEHLSKKEQNQHWNHSQAQGAGHAPWQQRGRQVKGKDWIAGALTNHVV